MAHFSSVQMLSVSFLLAYYTSGRQTLVWFGYNDQGFDIPFHFLCLVDSMLAINITLDEGRYNLSPAGLDLYTGH